MPETRKAPCESTTSSVRILCALTDRGRRCRALLGTHKGRLRFLFMSAPRSWSHRCISAISHALHDIREKRIRRTSLFERTNCAAFRIRTSL